MNQRRISGLARLCLLLVLFAAGSLALAAEPLRIAGLPFENREATVRAYTPLVNYLQRLMRRPVELVYLDSYQAIMDALDGGQLEVGMLGPLSYSALYRRNPMIEPLVVFRERSGEGRFRCALVRFAGDKLDADKLRGKRIALPARLAACSYLLANAIVQERSGHGLEETRYQFFNNHQEAALAVIGGQADAAVIKDEFATANAALGLEVIATSDWIPSSGLFVNRARLDAQLIKELRRILLAIPPEEYQRWAHVLKYGMAEATARDFDVMQRFGDPSRTPLTGKP